jgi:hypothetical protein
MAKQFPRIEPAHRDFIAGQKIFFTGSAAAEGRVNISPRGTDLFRLIGDQAALYLDLTGSGSETAAHLRLHSRLTMMFCALEGAPMILRLFGKGRVLPRSSDAYRELLSREFGGDEPAGARQIVWLDLEMVQTSCGWAVPLFDYRAERPNLTRWAEHKGDAELEAYRQEKNAFSIDGFPTGMAEEEDDAVSAAAE